MKIAILGAGVSGLALARLLNEGGVDLESLHLFEASPHIGGLCRSKTVEGFTYDIAGGHILFSKDAGVMQWMKDCAGGDDAFVRKDRNTCIRFGEDTWVQYPFENGIGDLPEQARYECLRGYVLSWHQRQMDGSSAPPDFKSWIRWRFGDGIADHFMDPYNEKVWKRDLEHITSGWVAGRVPDAPVEDVLRSAVGIKTEGYQHQAIFYYPKQGGFQAITDGIATTVMDRVRLSTPVTDVVKNGESFRVNGEEFDLVISTLPLTDVPRIVDGVPADVADAMQRLEYNSITCYLLALNRPEHPDLSWVYLPHHEQGPANRVTYMSNYSPGNAPEGKTSFLCEVTRPGDAPEPGPELEKEIVDGMVWAGLVDRSELLFADHTSMRHAYVVFDHHYEARRKLALEWMETHGVLPLGRFGRFEYDNSDQCVIKSKALAASLLEKIAAG